MGSIFTRSVRTSASIVRALAAGLLATLVLSSPALATDVDLDQSPLNGEESIVTTTTLQSTPPIKISNKVSNNAAEGFRFFWPGAGPGGFNDSVNPGPGAASEWVWQTWTPFQPFTGPIEFTPDLQLPVFGMPSGGIQSGGGDMTFQVAGKNLFGDDPAPLSSATLTSSQIAFFSPPVTITEFVSEVQLGVYRTTVTINPDQAQGFPIQADPINCCPTADQTFCGEICIDYLNDEANCGGCGNQCEAFDGVTSCDFGCCFPRQNCNGTCTDFQEDPLNCGQCGAACDFSGCVDGTGSCNAGVCECDEIPLALFASLGGANAGADDGGAIVTIDQQTGEATVIGTPYPGAGLPGLAFDSTGRLFATTSEFCTFAGGFEGCLEYGARLIEVDPDTGTLIDEIGVLYWGEGPGKFLGGGGIVTVTDLAFQPGTDILFGTTGFGGAGVNNLVTINTSTAEVTVVDDCEGTFGGDEGQEGAEGFVSIAFAPDGTLYGKDRNGSTLWELDPSDCSALSVQTVSPSIGGLGLGVRPTDGQLFASDCCGGKGESVGNDIYTIDPTTAAATFVGSAGGNRRVHDFAFGSPPTGGDGGEGEPGECCEATPGVAGCLDLECEDFICDEEPFCCDTEWDEACAAAASDFCSCGGGGEAASCCEATNSPGCPEDPNCEDIVCGQDPFCCNIEWDNICAEAAADFCGCQGGGEEPAPSGESDLDIASARSPNEGSSALTASISSGRSSGRQVRRSSDPAPRGPRIDRSRERVVRKSKFERPDRTDFAIAAERPRVFGGEFPDWSRAAGRSRSISAIPVGTSKQGRRALSGRADKRLLATPAEVSCSVIDFEGVVDTFGPVGTIPGTPNTIFGPSWIAFIDADEVPEGLGNIANEPSPSTAVTFLVDDPQILTQNSATPAGNAAARAAWLADIGISEAEIEFTVDFESGFEGGENVADVTGLFPGGLVIRDSGPVSSGSAIVRGTGYGGSIPVGALAVAHDEEAYLELDFTANPVDYVAFQDIDQAGTTGIVSFVDGSTTTISFETTGFGGNSAEFFGIFRNTRPRITYVQLDATGDGQWGIDNILYGQTDVPGGADPIDFDAGVQFVQVSYSASESAVPLTLKAWDGPGGTGSLVDSVVGTTIGTSPPADCQGDPTGAFCLWDVLELTSASNNILSVTIEGAEQNSFAFDNMQFCTGLPEKGACCTGDFCQVVTQGSCEFDLGGTYLGDNTTCDPDACGDPYIVGVVEAGECVAGIEQTLVQPGVPFEECVDGLPRVGKQVFTKATVFNPDGSVSAQGPFAVVVPDFEMVIGDFLASPIQVLLFDESGDYVVKPGETATLTATILNVGFEDLTSVRAELISPQNFINPWKVTFNGGVCSGTPPTPCQSDDDCETPEVCEIGNSIYPTIPGLSDADLGDCENEPTITFVTNEVDYEFTLDPGQQGNTMREFKLVFSGIGPDGPATHELKLPIGIGEACDPQGDIVTHPYDGLSGLNAPIDAVLAPREYPLNESGGSFTVGQTVPITFDLFCGDDDSDPDTYDFAPRLFEIVHETDGDLLDDLIPDRDDRFFECSGSNCTFNLDTSLIPAGTIAIQIEMPGDARVFQAGITLN